MKKIIALLLAVLLLSGCQPNTPAETTAAPNTTAIPETTAAPTEMTLPEDVTLPTVTYPGGIFGNPEGDEIPFENPGKVRIDYTGPRSYVMYVTRVEDLPDQEALKGYDEVFFEEHALLVVVETLSSGSVQLDIGGLYRNGDNVLVTLKRTVSGDVGTTDMATWLLWAEVSRELDCAWSLDSGASEPENSKY